MDEEKQQEKIAQNAIKAEAIRQLKETDGWRYVSDWINKEISYLKEKTMIPGYEDWNSYILEKGKYQGLISILKYIDSCINKIK